MHHRQGVPVRSHSAGHQPRPGRSGQDDGETTPDSTMDVAFIAACLGLAAANLLASLDLTRHPDTPAIACWRVNEWQRDTFTKLPARQLAAYPDGIINLLEAAASLHVRLRFYGDSALPLAKGLEAPVVTAGHLWADSRSVSPLLQARCPDLVSGWPGSSELPMRSTLRTSTGQ